LNEVAADSVDSTTGIFNSGPKIVLRYKHNPINATQAPSSLIVMGCDVVVKFTNVSDRDFVLQSLQTAISRCAWVTKTVLASNTGFTTSGAGIGGIIKRKKEVKAREAQLTENAFSGDLESLMKSASDVVKIVEKYVAKSSRDKPGGAGGTGGTGATGEEKDGGSELNEQDNLNTLLQNMGLVNAVTQQSAGTLFHSELSKELSRFLDGGIMSLYNGVITLPELYCLYNRARGVDLISPEDLLLASKKLSKTDNGMNLVTFKSGVMVIQTDDYNPSVIAQTLLKHLKQNTTPSDSNKGLSIYDACKLLKATPVLALEMCKEAENTGMICRDEDVEGVLFYENMFEVFFEKNTWHDKGVAMSRR
jgi:ESCRT-II complex subunit VPS36